MTRFAGALRRFWGAGKGGGVAGKSEESLGLSLGVSDDSVSHSVTATTTSSRLVVVVVVGPSQVDHRLDYDYATDYDYDYPIRRSR